MSGSSYIQGFREEELGPSRSCWKCSYVPKSAMIIKTVQKLADFFKEFLELTIQIWQGRGNSQNCPTEEYHLEQPWLNIHSVASKEPVATLIQAECSIGMKYRSKDFLKASENQVISWEKQSHLGKETNGLASVLETILWFKLRIFRCEEEHHFVEGQRHHAHLES